jgi:hypothetical protein
VDRRRAPRTNPRSGPLWCVGALLFAALFAGAVGAQAADTEPAPPPDAVAVREVQAGGVQVYGCRRAADGSFAWTLIGPKALLVNDDGSDFGTHSAGPTWTAADGSTITADGAHPLQKIDRPQSVPALLLRVTTRNGNGALSGIRFVRRSDTEGGLPPSTGCDAAHLDATTASHYSAIYTFYR